MKMEKIYPSKPLLLSEKDREILFRLSLNGRISLTTLGQQVNLSKQAVSYRIKNMEEAGIIKKYYAITNIYRLGKTHYRVFIKYHNMNSDTESELRQYLISHPRIAWVLYLAGDFDLFFVVWADHIIQFEEVYDAIMGKFGRYFQEKYFSIATRIEYLPYRFLLENFQNQGPMKSFVFGNGFGQYLPDLLEKQMLTIFNHNGRMYFTEMATQLGVTSRMIKRKINDLIENRIVIGFNVKIDHNLLGYTYQKTLLKLNDTSPAELERLSVYLKRQSSVIYLLKTIGTYDFEFEMMTRSPEEYYQLVKKLRLEFTHNIKDHSMVIMSDEPKYEYLEL